jgi:acetyl-CoA C-acetyltransferase
MVQRVCGTGIEVLMQAADFIAHRGHRARALRQRGVDEPQPGRLLPCAAFMGAVGFKDFLWEALLDPAANVSRATAGEPRAPI